ncbi:zinc finger protein 708-like [Paralichthys olivaceus]|uniref:zinc finger protein 708-like n=1 Tax=Paralichthys olivaceus TaxID=8255 RepID=UPI00375159BD
MRNADEKLSQTRKAPILREFVTERLAAASREILAAVERTVSGYEEEAAGFRLEVERQRRQLEALLQPRVKLQRAGVKRRRILGHADEEEADEEKLEELKNQTPSSPQGKSVSPQTSETQNHVHLRIRILDDPQTEVLSKNVLKKCPMLKLKCPRGLEESDFLDLLRCTFPQLATNDKPLDILTSDRGRKLRCLKLKTVTPEELHRNISRAGRGTSTLFIRPKAQTEPEAREEEIQRLRTRDDGTRDSSSASTGVLMLDDVSPRTSGLVQEMDVVSSGSTLQQREDNDDEDEDEDEAQDAVCRPAAESEQDTGDDDEKEEDREKFNDSDDDWKPLESDDVLRDSDVALSCHVCGARLKSDASFVKHAWSHVDDPGSVCGVCGESSETDEALKHHLQSLHKTDDCHMCGESFLNKLGLDEHVAAHSGETPHRCDVCDAAFALKVSLENHQKRHTEAKLHKCFTCHKVFKLKEQLKAHRRTHANKKTHLCGVCGKSLSNYRSLSRHKMTHSAERPHGCQVCGRSFKLIGTLRQHEKIHTDRERSYLCDVCCKMFLTSLQLENHMRTHTNEKPYNCGECGRRFSTKGSLTVHMRVHTGETPYRCPDCGWAFKRKTNLDNHMTVHSGVKAYVCGICGKACARKTHLTVHMRTHNGERPYKCTHCDKAFTQSHCLKTHMKSHLVAESVT